MTIPFRFSTFAALAVGVSLVATPVAALDLPVGNQAPIATGVSDQADWGRGRRHRDDGIDAGDVIAGVLVLGAIAAIVGDSNSREDDRRRREQARSPQREYRPPTRPATGGNFQSSRGIDSAVSMCVDQVERGDTRVDTVDNAARTADGWRVSGVLEGGAAWNCWIDNDGRIREVDLANISGAGGGSGYSTAAAGEGQLSDEAYARARAAQGSAATPDAGTQPAYPGGPLPGEEGYAEAVQLSTAR